MPCMNPAPKWVTLEWHKDAIAMFAIYERPQDYPRHFVVRRWFVCSDGKVVVDRETRLAKDLDDARALLPRGLHRLERSPEDQPQIREIWV